MTTWSGAIAVVCLLAAVAADDYYVRPKENPSFYVEFAVRHEDTSISPAGGIFGIEGERHAGACLFRRRF